VHTFGARQNHRRFRRPLVDHVMCGWDTNAIPLVLMDSSSKELSFELSLHFPANLQFLRRSEPEDAES
jgi:hypothetical protein